MKKKQISRLIGSLLCVAMVFTLVAPVQLALADGGASPGVNPLSDPVPLATPVHITANGTGNVNGTNMTQWQNFRAIMFTPDADAASYTLWVYATAAAASACTDGSQAIAKSANITGSTALSGSTGGTGGTTGPNPAATLRYVDVRLLRYENVGASNAVRPGEGSGLPAGATPGGIADSYFSGPNPSQGDTTNLRPGQYWFKLQAVARDQETHSNSNLSANIGPLSITMGPTEAKALILSRMADRGKTFHIVDLRPPTAAGEVQQEGWLRYTTINNNNSNTAATMDPLLLTEVGGDTARRGEITVLVY